MLAGSHSNSTTIPCKKTRQMITYIASVAQAYSVHASSHHLHNFLWQGHKGRLLPLKDVLAVTQLSNITHAHNKNLACLLPMTPVGNCHTHNFHVNQK